MKSVDILLFHRIQRDEDAKKLLHIEGVVIDAKTKETLVGATVMVTDGTQKRWCSRQYYRRKR